uniref:Odorant receptor n=1 Tax=Conopomorpha sinensis TaxID=940481 RepID=A0A3S7SGT6_9NEOP|nr:putative odorant receptor 36 [Conopomorpha sinensis]
MLQTAHRWEDMFRLTNLAFKLVGVNMSGSNSSDFLTVLKETWWFYISTLWMYTDVLGECYWFFEGVQTNKSFSELTFVAPCIVIGFVATAKVTAVLYNRNTTRKLLDILKELYPANAKVAPDDDVAEGNKIKEERDAELDEEETNVIEDSRNLSMKVVNILFWTNVATMVVFNFSPMAVMLYTYSKTKKIELGLPFIIKYPFDAFQLKVYPWVYLHQAWSSTAAVISLFAGDTMYCLSCTQLHLQFHLLRIRFQKLLTLADERDEEGVRRNLIDLMKQHQVLIRLVEMLEQIYTKSNFCNYICSSGLICLTGFNVTTNSDTVVVMSFLVFLSSNVSQVFLLCYFGDMVSRSSMEIANGICNSCWYKMPVKIKRTLLFVMMRCRKPCRITAFKYVTVDLTTFTKVLSTAWSYFALLRTMYTPSMH